ncbi:tyrosine-type recombinase/integrase [Phytohabitans sp. LJ34]|uniref:tyrosine-type recombinase/integrase n=1 Tax=Phytohabitans sp. LJ34 TaxID=3452217 RepID=UPI003F8A3A66
MGRAASLSQPRSTNAGRSRKPSSNSARSRGKGGKVVLVPLPPAIARAIDRAVDGRLDGPILRNSLGARMDRHAATRRLKHLAATAGIRMPRMHPHMLRHRYVTTMLDAGVSLRDVQIAARHADPPHHHAVRPRPQEPRPLSELHPRCVHGLWNVAGLTTLPRAVRSITRGERMKSYLP